MERTITSEHLPIKLWLSELDADTGQQVRNLANHPDVFHHIALMADAHVGYGMPIGGVAATLGGVIPNAVGVDIGCGICTVQTSLTDLNEGQLKTLLGAIRHRVPLGFNHHRQPQDATFMPRPAKGLSLADLPIVNQEFLSGRSQIGTLGGGNHFIEIQGGDDHHLWLMIHSGSRNLGFKVAEHYNRLAIAHTRQTKKAIPTAWQLDSLPVDSVAGRQYLAEMAYCVAFAAANRRMMLHRVVDLIQELFAPVHFAEPIDVAHNYATLETHFGQKVMVHRKGAIRAGLGEIGIIPGSQGSASYIVIGKGNQDSFCSCAHGAGRRLGRKQAQKQLDLSKEIAKLEAQGIVHGLRGKRDLEEATGAYKDIEEVIARQEDLVTISHRLQPIAVIKG